MAKIQNNLIDLKPTVPKIGRPSNYTPRYCQQVVAHMAEGYPLETFGVKIGVDRRTLYNWAEKHSKFFHALMFGREASYKWWIDQGRKAVTGRTKSFSAGVGQKLNLAQNA